MQEIADSCKEEFPKASEAIRNCLFMDDLELSMDSAQELMTTQQQINKVLKKHHFDMTKWATNEKELADTLYGSQNDTKVLGMKWIRLESIGRYQTNHQVVKLL